MKKVIALILVGIMLLSFTSCKDKEADTDSATGGKTPVSVEEKIIDVTVTITANFFTDQTAEEIEATAKEKGIKKCTINEDGSVTYTMSKTKHKELLEEFRAGIDSENDALVNGESKIASFVKIDVNDECSQFDIYVDPDKYSSWDSMNTIMFYFEGLYYQCLLGKNYEEIDIVVNYIDNETSEVLDTASYRKYIESVSSTEE